MFRPGLRPSAGLRLRPAAPPPQAATGRTAARNAERRRYAVATSRIAAPASIATRLPHMLATHPDTKDAVSYTHLTLPTSDLV